MRDLNVFEAVVETSVERIPLVDVRCFDVVDDRECEISHVVYRNVFTEFDQKLSRHLAAVTGVGFPTVTASIRIRERRPNAKWQAGRGLHFPSVPHALRGIAARALKGREMAEMFIHAPDSDMMVEEAPAHRQEIRKGDIGALSTALEFCALFGEPDFVDLSGDYDILMAQPAGLDLKPITVDLYRGSVSVYGVHGDGKDVFEGPIFDYKRLMLENATVRGYLASARHTLAAAKEDAVHSFRSAAETRILNFDRALAGRPLENYRLEAVISLVARLKAGLGDSLCGLSEDAQITALDWSDSIERAAGSVAASGTFSTLDYLLRGPHRAA
ncbi:hypothetical protein H0I76_02115 [Limibaculum sp. M0105]|uniref:Uncharacterized protein n=1 Tax=Thermohalobaculum xanthum TaxID=2753746 RepID=A0A8J7M577_9RHOB|nr:hypothetical protein [Thermohalobaculum xanthum]MBK0397972.1 hypothetical protein [Thermohalobaculum xanthum]